MSMGLMLMNEFHQAPPAALGCKPLAKTARRPATSDFKQPRAACTALFWIGDRVIIQSTVEDLVIPTCTTASSVMLVPCYLQAVVPYQASFQHWYFCMVLTICIVAQSVLL